LETVDTSTEVSFVGVGEEGKCSCIGFYLLEMTYLLKTGEE
jgi:hypothetical protein